MKVETPPSSATQTPVDGPASAGSGHHVIDTLESPRDFGQGILRDLRRAPVIVLGGFFSFLPAGIAVLLCEPASGIKAGAIFLFVTTFYFAGAARALGYPTPPAAWCAIQRGVSHFVNMLLLLLVLGFMWIPAIVVALVIDEHYYEEVPLRVQEWIFVVLGVTASAWLLRRAWPTPVVTFTCAPAEARSTWRGEWHGPGFGVACRVTRAEGTFRRFTLPLAIHTAILGTAYGLVGWLLGAENAGLTRLVGYWVVFPIWSVIIVGLGGELHRIWREGSAG